MRPTFRQLEYLVAVADAGQVGLAAAQLNVSQPSLSAQLSEIETDLGVTLFHRSRSGAKITPAGEDTVRRARQILHALQDLRAAAQGGGIFHGRLRLGVLPSIGPYLLPAVVQRLHREHPSLRLIIREEDTRNLDEGLRNGRLDMVISTPEDHPGMRETHLFTETLWAAMAFDHPLATPNAQTPSAALKLSDLAGSVFLTLGAGHRLSHSVAGLATSAGGRVSDEYEGTSLDAIRLMAATGTGVAILPSIYAATEARRGTDVRLRALNTAAAQRDIALIQPNLPDPRSDSDMLASILRSEAEIILAAHANLPIPDDRPIA